MMMNRLKKLILASLAIFVLMGSQIITANAATMIAGEDIFRTGSTFYGLEPEREYAHLVVREEKSGDDLTSKENLLYIDQGKTDLGGRISFEFDPVFSEPGIMLLRGENDETAKEINWSLSGDGELTIWGTDGIPTISEAFPAPWNSVTDKVKTIRILPTITALGDGVFADCPNLEYIVIEGNMPDLSPNAFAGFTGNVFYPVDDPTWIPEDLKDYAGDVNWVAGTPRILVTSITLNENQLILSAQDTFQLTAQVAPENAENTALIWDTSDSTVADVSENGMVTARAKGTATVTAMAADGSGTAAQCEVTVLNSIYTPEDTKQLESPHPYENHCSDVWIYTSETAEAIVITFDTQTELGEGDYLILFESDGRENGRFTGQELAGESVTLLGNVVKIQLLTNASGNAWGFRVADLTEVAHVHQNKVLVVPPTCTEDGYTQYTCTECGRTCTDTPVAALGHTEQWIPETAPTCTEDGLTKGKECTVCGVVTLEQENIPATGHQEVTIPAKAATCTEEGLTKGRKCSVCGTITMEQEMIPTIAHKEETIPAKAATCTEEGLTKGRKCSVCGTITMEQEKIPVLAHKEETIPAKAATCTEEGLTKGRKCSVCGTITLEQEKIPVLAHKEETIPGKAATCTEDGLTEGKRCTVCGTVTVAQVPIKAAGHVYTDDKDPSCTVCGEEREIKTDSIPMFRMYDPNSGEHFYTGSEVEREFLVNAGWHYEGVGFNFPEKGAPVHRLYDPVFGEHLYTMDKQEMNRLLARGWNYEGVAFNSAGSDAVPQYRLHNPNAKRGGYHFTGSVEERDLLISFGWIPQGIGWYSCLE